MPQGTLVEKSEENIMGVFRILAWLESGYFMV